LAAPYPPPPAAAPAGNDKTTLWGVLGIILALPVCCWPLGVLFGVLSLLAAKKSGKPPTLAYVAFGIAVVSALINIGLLATGNMPGLKK
jgi:hypothetical protein